MAEVGGCLDLDTVEVAYEEMEFLEALQKRCETESQLRSVWDRMAEDLKAGYPWTLVPEFRDRLREVGVARMKEIKEVRGVNESRS